MGDLTYTTGSSTIRLEDGYAWIENDGTGTWLPWDDLQKLVVNMGFQLLNHPSASGRVEPAGEEE